VHRLPPDLSGPEAEHATMQAIGESDRMTLRFVKP
jgi:predicted methyltransferase